MHTWPERLGFRSAVSSTSVYNRLTDSRWKEWEATQASTLETQEIRWSWIWLADCSSLWCPEKRTDERYVTPDWMELDCCVSLCLQRLEKILNRLNLELFKAFLSSHARSFLALLNIYTVILESWATEPSILGFWAALLGQLSANALFKGSLIVVTNGIISYLLLFLAQSLPVGTRLKLAAIHNPGSL